MWTHEKQSWQHNVSQVADGIRYNTPFRSMLAAHAATATSALIPKFLG